MNISRQYFFGLIFIGVGIFQMVKADMLEASLYLLAGLAFIFNTLAAEKKLLPYKKTLVIITWTLMIVTALLFLWVLQFKYL